MTEARHGLTVGVENNDHEIFLSMKAIGKLTHEDYEKITPVIDSALDAVSNEEVNVFIDGTELEGWELRAAWDDFKMGMKHNKQFHKVAIYGNKEWQEKASKVGSWFTSGEVKFFDNQQKAMDWLH
ncbi:MAG: STAS/SEC14 domain-containing protein [Cellvibrionales bacterium]|nr:STAS/SEC14 domain-containing protein [Cellvibrionales bacterium]